MAIDAPTPSELIHINFFAFQKETSGNIFIIKHVIKAILNVIILIHPQPTQVTQVPPLQVDVS